VDKYIKQIQTRMNRQLKSREQSVTKQQVRDVYSAVVKNPDKPTDVEMSVVTEKLANQISSLRDASRMQEETLDNGQLTVSAHTEIEKPEIIEIISESHPDIWETLEPPSEQPEPQEKAPASQLNEALALLNVEENKPAQQSSSGIIPQNEVKGIVSQVFAGQPQEFKDQISEYAMQHSFLNVRQVQEFLEQLRGMEFNLLVSTLQDHFKRRGSMLTVLNEVITSQKQKDKESSQSFFNSFQSRLASFQQEMETRLSKPSL
jgi:hypothetical protein